MKKNLKYLNLLLIIVLTYCSSNITNDDAKSYLDLQEITYENICVENGIANWNMLSNEGSIDLETPKAKYAKLFFEPKLNEIIDKYYAERNNIQDRIFRRRIETWHNIITAGKVDFNPNLVRLRSKLELWISGNVAKDQIPSQDVINDSMVVLYKMRNAKAKEMGFPNYAYMVHELSGLGYKWFMGMIDTFDKETERPYQELLAKTRADAGKENITGADIQKYLNKIRPKTEQQAQQKTDPAKVIEILKESARNIGIDPDKYPIRFVENKMPYGGNGISIKVPTDFRIVMLPGMEAPTWMHELGHGFHGVFTNTPHPILRGYEWCLGSETMAYSEGMATVNANFSNNPLWQQKYYGREPKGIVFDDYTRYLQAYMMRRSIAAFVAEIENYAQIDRNLTDVRNEIDKKYLLIDTGNKRKVYITSMYDVSYPVYSQNYYIAGMIAWQVHETLEKKFGKDYAFNKNVGKFLEENFWRYGAEYTWQEKLKMGTGRELDVVGFIRSRGVK